jgi:hypothetical protein
MNESLYQELRELSWRRKLTPEEETELQGWLAAHPDKQAEWELEQSLSEQLRHLSNAPLSSNFTSQVMRTLDAELSRQEREGRGGRTWLQWLHRFAPRLAPVSLALVVAVTFFVYQRSDNEPQRLQHAKVIESVATAFAEADQVPSHEILADFEAIEKLPFASDDDLLAALNE